MAELQPIIVFHGRHFSAILEFVIRFVNVNVNYCNALEYPKGQKCGYLLLSIEAMMVQVCFELRSE